MLWEVLIWNKKNREITVHFKLNGYTSELLDLIYDLIKADLVEKVGD